MICKGGEHYAGLSVGEILAATGGKLLAGAEKTQFSAVSIDSRAIRSGELFWAIKGENHDGNDFREEALQKGAAGFVTDNSFPPDGRRDGPALVRVDSSLKALQLLAAYNRRKHPVPLVAVTGSNGKTTTKEIVASILKERYEVLKSEGNLNNLIGVPLTLLRLHSDHEAAVVEMGMNREGEIRELTRMAKPDIGVITSIGEAHLEGLGSLENIKRAKGELIEAMEDEKAIILNADDDAVMELKGSARGDVLTFGIKRRADIMASDIDIEWGKGTMFILSDGRKSLPVLLPLYGEHQLYNALAASAVASCLGFDLHEIREGIESYEAYAGRMEIISEAGVSIINDSYNSNPPSLRCAVETMKKISSGRKIAVLGDMLEMGEMGEDIHYETGRYIAGVGVDILITIGRLAGRLGEGAVAGGLDALSLFSFGDRSDVSACLKKLIREGDWVLVKGSRGMRMDEFAAELLDYLKNKGEN